MAKKREENKDLIKDTNEPHIIDVPLGAEERAKLVDELTSAGQKWGELEDEKKAVSSDFTAKINNIKERIKALSNQLLNGKAKKSVECTLRLNYSKLTATLIRNDTEEVLEERPMTEEEKQMQFSFDDETDLNKNRSMAETVAQTEGEAA